METKFTLGTVRDRNCDFLQNEVLRFFWINSSYWYQVKHGLNHRFVSDRIESIAEKEGNSYQDFLLSNNVLKQGCSLTLYQTTKFLELPKLKDNKINVTQKQKFALVERQQNKCDPKMEICFGIIENILGKGENAGYQHFSFSHNVFKRLHFQGF